MLSLALPGVFSAGAGRAFPIDSENYVIEQFQSVNPDIVSINHFYTVIDVNYVLKSYGILWNRKIYLIVIKGVSF